jgi:hypothetical protein
MAKTMTPLSKRASRSSNRGWDQTAGGRCEGNTKPVDIMVSGASTKQSTGATILNRTGIKVESDATTIVNDLTARKEFAC